MSYNDLSTQKTPDATPLVTPVVESEGTTPAVDAPETATPDATSAEAVMADEA
jgi:hypothetical protein